MKTPRRRFPPKVYRDILDRQGWKCACGCGASFDSWAQTGRLDFHYDHILPLWLGGKDEPENLQALKRGHHAKKTHKEASARAKVKRIIAQRGLLDKKMSQRDKVMAKVLAEG